MIKSEHSKNHNSFFENPQLNQLVDLSLQNLDNDVFLNIITLITLKSLGQIEKNISLCKADPDCLDVTIYNDILSIFEKIFTETSSSNLRGAFLELLTFKFINKKYNPYQSDFDCYVITNGIKSEKTVDVFALCENFKGIVCECKLSHTNLKDSHLSNLNKIYHNSEKILVPYIIALSKRELVDEALNQIVENHDNNTFVYLGEVNIISNSNLSDFFNF